MRQELWGVACACGRVQRPAIVLTDGHLRRGRSALIDSWPHQRAIIVGLSAAVFTALSAGLGPLQRRFISDVMPADFSRWSGHPAAPVCRSLQSTAPRLRLLIQTAAYTVKGVKDGSPDKNDCGLRDSRTPPAWQRSSTCSEMLQRFHCAGSGQQ